MFKLQCSINSHLVFDTSIGPVLSLVIISLATLVITLSSTRLVGENPTKIVSKPMMQLLLVAVKTVCSLSHSHLVLVHSQRRCLTSSLIPQ